MRKVAKLIRKSCGAEEDVPVVHWGPGIPEADSSKLYCLMEGHTESMEMPKHCDVPMKYVKE